jgi:hypothetical protein|tara:strand:+ start:495 stop:605 length:111 start_codon:yes stop_codon:yes gene_type:complete
MEELIEIQDSIMDLNTIIIAYIVFFTIGIIETKIWK